ncbi:alpha/beta fold hydrolase [Actinomadura luteofluorescens]
MTTVHHRYATVNGRRLFYREAGPAAAPAVVLLHGFPTSSFMFRHLIPPLADRYRVIAPDHLGFGLSDAPAADEFDYTFDALAGLTEELLDQLGADRYALYVQDYGAPVGWRLALGNPDAVTAVITQSGNGYEAGFAEEFWKPVREYWRDQNPQTEAGVRQALTLEAIRWQYLHGVPDETLVSPDTWNHDFAQVSRPGNDLVQLALLADYAAICRCIRSCTPGSGPAGCRCWRCGAGATRSSGPRARWRSRRTRPALRSTCWTQATSCWKATWTSPRPTSAGSWAGRCRDRTAGRSERAGGGTGRWNRPRGRGGRPRRGRTGHRRRRDKDTLAAAYAGEPAIRTETVDVTDDSSIAALGERLGGIDHVVSTASARARGRLADLDREAVRLSFDTKVIGPLMLAKHLAPG